jgi:hypothetical protein
MGKTLTPEEKNDISIANARQFLAELREAGCYSEFYGSEYNSDLMQQWIVSQVGNAYPFSVENYWAAYDYLAEHGRFETRPVETVSAPQVRRASSIMSELSLVLADDQAIADQFKSMGNGPTSEPLNKENLAKMKAAATKQRVQMTEARGDSYARIQERKYSA